MGVKKSDSCRTFVNISPKAKSRLVPGGVQSASAMPVSLDHDDGPEGLKRMSRKGARPCLLRGLTPCTPSGGHLDSSPRHARTTQPTWRGRLRLAGWLAHSALVHTPRAQALVHLYCPHSFVLFIRGCETYGSICWDPRSNVHSIL
jgi:hypothetical protein